MQSVYFNAGILGNPNTGKTSFLRCLSSSTEACLTDPNSEKSFIFRFEELTSLPEFFSYTCVMLTYSVCDYSSFRAVKEVWLPKLYQTMNFTKSFVMIIGTHSDLPISRTVSTDEADDLSAENGALHVEVSAKTKSNIELVKKLMRSRASYMVKKQFLSESTEADIVNFSSPKVNKSCNSSEEETFELSEPKTTRYDLPLNNTDKSSYLVNYEDPNLSFANMSSFEEDELFYADQEVTPRNLDLEFSSEPYELSFPDSPTWKEKLHNTPVLMVLEINLNGKIQTVNLLKDSNAYEVASKFLGGSEDIEELAELIQQKVNEYCSEIVLPNKVLYKIKVDLGNKLAEIPVRENDCPKKLAKDFAEVHQLTSEVENEVYKLIKQTQQEV